MLKDFLRSFFLVDLVKGLWVTLKYTPQPAFTFQYPSERRPVAPRFRGVLRLQVEPDSGAQVCIVCDQCAKACPDDLISLGGHREPGMKLKALDYFDFNLSRCSFCGLCAEVCPTKPIKALVMSEDYELGTYSRDAQILRIDDMHDGLPITQYTQIGERREARGERRRAARCRPSASNRPGSCRFSRPSLKSAILSRTVTEFNVILSGGCMPAGARPLWRCSRCLWPSASSWPSMPSRRPTRRKSSFNSETCSTPTGASVKRSRPTSTRSAPRSRACASRPASGWFSLRSRVGELPEGQDRGARCCARSSPSDAFALAVYGDAMWSAGLFDEAERGYAEALALQPEEARGHNGVARVLSARGPLRRGAGAQPSRRSGSSPREADFHHTLGNVYERLGRTTTPPRPWRASSTCSRRASRDSRALLGAPPSSSS
ncbi:MAG: 4Fe-4S binding protein [Candidatus Moduliflexus flocculans]|nr:4Fe-4S binding protein [Candidatus Moduliflexus flocculans]